MGKDVGGIFEILFFLLILLMATINIRIRDELVLLVFGAFVSPTNLLEHLRLKIVHSNTSSFVLEKRNMCLLD